MKHDTSPAFFRRSGFARHRDLEHPSLRHWLDRCRIENQALTGTTRLDWSRQWEYPYVLANLSEGGAGSRILDAGSGFTFFPLLLARLGHRVCACDLAPRVGRRLRKAANREHLSLQFSVENLSSLSFQDGSFDVISCISVLEHAPDHEDILMELRRVLKKGGKLLLTFDVSIHGDRDIPVSDAAQLVRLATSKFRPLYSFDDRELLEPDTLARDRAVLKTDWFKQHAPELLPWGLVSKTMLRNLARGRFTRPFFSLSVIGLALLRD